MPSGPVPNLQVDSRPVAQIQDLLLRSLRHRVQNIHLSPGFGPDSARLAILFSGGLDCTLLARMCHDVLPLDHEVDLLNVAFENPRVLKAGIKASNQTSMYASCPDRITGMASHVELQKICPGRTWRFVSIDVPYHETLAHRSEVISLIYPNKTEMDLSIARALYFAARGSGTIYDSSTESNQSYATPARVLLSGLGADEMFAGYTRHMTAFTRRGHKGLAEELELDFSRLGIRNLGRDDRVISHWGKEVRYPYLDEDLVAWVLPRPTWEKCGFGQTESHKNCLLSGGFALQPSKLILRLLASRLGITRAAAEQKRAIQFGTRTAKMETGKNKGTEVVDHEH